MKLLSVTDYFVSLFWSSNKNCVNSCIMHFCSKKCVLVPRTGVQEEEDKTVVLCSYEMQLCTALSATQTAQWEPQMRDAAVLGPVPTQGGDPPNSSISFVHLNGTVSEVGVCSVE
jgi:hypothetical protein